MKLDDETISGIIDDIWDAGVVDFSDQEEKIREILKSLNLVIKPGDSSQSVLVEQCTKSK